MNIGVLCCVIFGSIVLLGALGLAITIQEKRIAQLNLEIEKLKESKKNLKEEEINNGRD